MCVCVWSVIIIKTNMYECAAAAAAGPEVCVCVCVCMCV